MPIPLNVAMGPRSPSGEFRNLLDMDSPPTFEESGTFESVTASMRLRDKALAYTAMRGEWHLEVTWRPTGQQIFRGLIRTPSRQLVVREHGIDIQADDMSVLLDRCVLTREGVTRAGGESLKARIAWLFGEATHGVGAWAGTRVAQPLLAAGFNYTTHVQQLDTNLPKQRFPPNLTLRQALERILGAVGSADDTNTANYYVAWPYLHVYDDDHPESTRRTPFDINTAHSPGAGKVAPEDMVVDWDTSRLVNGFYVRGTNKKFSSFYTDQDLLSGPWSVDLFGLRTAYLDGPDADSVGKVKRLARAALRDTRNPIPRISWKLSADKVADGSDRWQGGQLVYITSEAHGLNGSGTDPGPWAGAASLQPLRVVRATTRVISGDGEREVELEAGGRKRNVYQATV